MIRYVKYQNNVPKSPSYGKWYLRAVCDEQIDVDKLAEHMSNHNTPYSKGCIRGILVDMVNCIKELLLEGKSVKLQDLAIFKIGIVSQGAPTAAEAKSSLVSGFRFKARATGEMSINELKTDVQLKELKRYAVEEEENPGNEPETPETDE